MKKQVNLYQASCYPKREKATFTQFVIVFIVCVSLSVFSYFMSTYQTKSLNDSLVIQQSKIADQQLVLSDLVIELQKRRAPDEKLRLFSTLQNEVAAKQRLLATLSDIDVEDIVSFSALMRGLSDANMPDLSINQFSMVEGVLNISGDAKHSDSVPLWLSNMQVTKDLSGVAFKAITIKENRGFFSFQLSNSDLKGRKGE
ncbi:hypothetical protein CW745_05940 [Psychromonas sp. psych-6C06]|uniref:PilN domain-containing protein n=1 Tax=Psychromonas sp. psych-6C06 TaxID=2058089 RepID=UPI000C33E834|nr:PilN domain-containing protein [Psychromonas sp. psych-6C06]PKF62964.1 hypothetical protein CW745_05940 [Psychromonas sp. psych-6C06]